MSSPPSASETPSEKVARLRAELRAQRQGEQLSFADRAVAGGRKWADRAHRATTYGLLGLTGISEVVAVYGISSLVTHSRRQKRAFIESEMDRLRDAQQAFLRGDANAEQLHLLEQERAGEEMAAKWKADREKQKTRGLWAKAKDIFGAGSSNRDMGSETPEEAERREKRNSGSRILEEAWVKEEVRPAGVAESGVAGVAYDSRGRPVPANKLERVVEKVDRERRSGGDALEQEGRRGGQLDELASNVASVASTNSAGGWLSWFGGKR